MNPLPAIEGVNWVQKGPPAQVAPRSPAKGAGDNVSEADELKKKNNGPGNGTNNKKKKGKKGGGNQNTALQDLVKSLSTVVTEIGTLRKEMQTPRRGARTCNSICFRCHKKGHFARDCKQPAPGGVMCVVGGTFDCSEGGVHACECGQCHWSTVDMPENC